MARSGDREPNSTTIEVLQPGAEIAVHGALDVHSVADVRNALSRAIDDGAGDLVLHLGSAEIGDATGLGVIVGAHHRAMRAGRKLVLADGSARLERLMRATKLSRVIPLGRSTLSQPAALPA
ncbi:STAS domain-containing protein [Flexivirga meconopsidis]|uniref:STAS domain-containing protein n=1 Tax=Flexivirga meconopsidis TaxID=2977121 RepID=UPI00223FC367|nr:STAS domain-containing protein [Flexivirga meconopsidis]